VSKLKKEVITRKEIYAIRDAVTGAIEGTTQVTVRVEKKRPFRYEDFTMLFHAVNIVLLKKITPAATKLLLYLMVNMGYGNVVNRTIKQLMDELGYGRTQMWKALKELEEERVIIKEAWEGDMRESLIYLNPEQSWRGFPQDRQKTKRNLEDKAQLSLDLPIGKEKEGMGDPLKQFLPKPLTMNDNEEK